MADDGGRDAAAERQRGRGHTNGGGNPPGAGGGDGRGRGGREAAHGLVHARGKSGGGPCGRAHDGARVHGRAVQEWVEAWEG